MAKKVAKMAKKRQKYQISQNFVLSFYAETTISFLHFDFPQTKHKQFTIKIWKIVLSGPQQLLFKFKSRPVWAGSLDKLAWWYDDYLY